MTRVDFAIRTEVEAIDGGLQWRTGTRNCSVQGFDLSEESAIDYIVSAFRSYLVRELEDARIEAARRAAYSGGRRGVAVSAQAAAPACEADCFCKEGN